MTLVEVNVFGDDLKIQMRAEKGNGVTHPGVSNEKQNYGHVSGGKTTSILSFYGKKDYMYNNSRDDMPKYRTW